MIHLALLRHGATTWTASRRLQGRSDIPLSPAGRTAVAGWRLPEALLSWSWQTSPLARCRETADLLRCHHAGAPAAIVEPRLIEMSFGQWEGQRLAALRAADPDGVAAREARGLDFAAPDGESPRQVQARLAPWLAEIASAGPDVLAITHKGIIRALYAAATDWPMRGPLPAKLDLTALQILAVADGGGLTVDRLNLRLRAAENAPS